ncbi:hypothetical protein [Thiolapillus sp.]
MKRSNLLSINHFPVLFLLLASLWLAPALAGVNTAHPRIWLDSSTISRLQAAVSANTPEWQALKSWCDAHVGDNMRDYYQGVDWQRYMLNYALAYRATGNATYAQEAIVYLRALTYDAGGGYGSGVVGNGSGGASSITHDSGYGARSYGMSLPVGRDWLDGAPGLTSDLIRDINTRMDQWITWVFTNDRAYATEDPTDNYYAGYFSMVYTAAIGLAGDTGYKSEWLNRAESMWFNGVRPLINGLFDGGEWQEGWNYGHWAVREYLLYPVALASGTDMNTHWSETNWHEDLVKSQLHSLYPSRDYVSDNGSWSGDTKGDPRNATLHFLASFTPLNSTLRGIAAWGANKMKADTHQIRWENFLFANPNITEIQPNSTNLGGLSYSMKGHGMARGDEWSNTMATYVDVVGGLEENSQGEYNFGEVKIGSRGEILLVDADTWEFASEFANILTITGNHQHAPYQEGRTPDISFDVAGVPHKFAYFLSNNLEQAYDFDYDNYDDGGAPSASAYRREVAFLPPDHVIVLDNIQPTSEANRVTLQWHFADSPDLNGNLVSLTRGAGKLFLRPFGSSFDISVHDASDKRSRSNPPLNVQRVELEPTNGSTDLQLFSVFQAADSTTANMDSTTPVTSGAGNMKGINIDANNTALVAMFSKDTSLQKEVVYNPSFTQSTTRHLLTGMETGLYDIYVNNTLYAESISTSDKNTLYFETGEGSSFHVAKSGELQLLFSSGFE